MTNVTIQLTAEEASLFDILRTAGDQRGLTLRAAGGWVRDKLLGIESHDIDVTIDKMTGQQFAKECLRVPAAVIKANPEQSKQLETAKVRIAGFAVDLANLRDETGAGAYGDPTNRILQENVFASAQLDASRRDFRVGGLFYNLSTGEVEDFVGGLDNLFDEAGVVLDTPLDPVETFSQDPLRILRGCRFLSKLPRARFAKRVVEAANHPEVQRRFRERLTPERIATELLGQWEEEFGERSYKSGILNGGRFVEALLLLENSGLLDIILDVPLIRDWKPFRMDQKSKWHAYSVWDHTVCVMTYLKNLPFVQRLHAENPEREAGLLFAALLHDIGKRDPAKCQDKPDGHCSYHGHEDSSAEAARDICNKLCLSNDATDYIYRVVLHHMDPHGDGWGDRDATLRRFMNRLPDVWEDIIVHALADCLGSGSYRPPEETARYGLKIERCKWLLENDPNPATNQKPVLDGLIIMATIPQLKQGPWIKDTLKRLTEVRHERPETTEADLTALVAEWSPAIVADPQYAKFVK